MLSRAHGHRTTKTHHHHHHHHQQQPPPVTKPFQIPEAFGIVEPGVYRCSLPNQNHFPFLETLGLKSIVFLSQEVIEKSFSNFCNKGNIEFINLGISLVQYPSSHFNDQQSHHSLFYRNQQKQREVFGHDGELGNVPVATGISTTWKHCSEELIKEALELLLNRNNHPIMIMCSSGVHLTGTVIGCLRRLQNWSLSSVLEEYESFAQHESRYVNRQFIELFDVDLISLPSQLPHWFLVHKDLLSQERRFLNENRKKVAVKSTNVPPLTKDDKRLAFQEYWFCRDAPLISAKSTFSKHSVIEEEDD